MASKLMVNAAFDARLLLRPSHQRTVLFGPVNKLGYPIPGRPMLPPILSSRSYSDSTSTPPFPKSSRSTEDSQSSGPRDKNWFHPKRWVKVTVGLALITYITQEIWNRTFRRPVRESTIYDDKLKKGPVFQAIELTIPRKPLIEEIRRLITPTEYSRLYSLIIGEPGTGKTNLVKFAVNGMDEPKGVVYVDAEDKTHVDIAAAMRMALGWSPDQVIDSSKPASLQEILREFSRFAIKYKQEYGKIPVLIIDNANTLAQEQQEHLDLFQDYAKVAADEGIATVVFMSNGGVPRRMMERRSSWSRCGSIIEIGDVSKEEALQYLKLRKIDGEQATQIYELVGGRTIYLWGLADNIKHFTEMRQTMLSCAEQQLQSAGIYPGHHYYKDGAAIIRELLEKGSISDDRYYSLVGVDTGDQLLETNVFAFHFNSREITFKSAMMKQYCKENSALWKYRHGWGRFSGGIGVSGREVEKAL